MPPFDNELFAKLALLKPSQYGVALAIGADQVGFEDLGFRQFNFVPKQAQEFEDRYYAMAGLVPSRLQMLYLAAGYIGSRTGGSAVGAVGLVLFPGLLAIGEYDGVGSNLGLRALLSTQIKLDLALLHMQTIDTGRPFALVLENNVRFGVSYAEVWP
jgi:hypothetical protein